MDDIGLADSEQEFKVTLTSTDVNPNCALADSGRKSVLSSNLFPAQWMPEVSL